MENLVEVLGNISERGNRINENDYIGEDGFYHCSVCHQPKQCKIEVGGVPITVNCICKCREKEIEEEKRNARYNNKLIRTEEYRDLQFNYSADLKDDDGSPQTETSKKYIDNFEKFKKEGNGLLMFGGIGAGKTWQAVMIANELKKQKYITLVTSSTNVVQELHAREFDGKSDYLNGLSVFDLIVLDDLGAERGTSYGQEQMKLFIDTVYNKKISLVVTTNIPQAELKNPKEVEQARIYSRIIERCYPVVFKNEDRRRKQGQNAFNEMHELLK